MSANRKLQQEIERTLKKHKEHIRKLEQVLRLLNNEQTTPDMIMDNLKDQLEYYLEACTEPDFIDDDTVYDEFPLDMVDVKDISHNVDHSTSKATVPPTPVPTSPTAAASAAKLEKEKEAEKEREKEKEGTLQQYLAAKLLKAQGWRFHTKFGAWFMRSAPPVAVTEKLEAGPYIYFDPTFTRDTKDGAPSLDGWCQRSKNEMVFEYSYLEDELR
eukprot:jgi/Pico_ML_1/55777/g1419.t1